MIKDPFPDHARKLWLPLLAHFPVVGALTLRSGKDNGLIFRLFALNKMEVDIRQSLEDGCFDQ